MRLENEVRTLSRDVAINSQALRQTCNENDVSIPPKWYNCCYVAPSDIYPLRQLPRRRVRMSCPSCLACVRTRTKYHIRNPDVSNCAGRLWCMLTPCLIFPCFRNILHYCPDCGVLLGHSRVCHPSCYCC